MIKNFLIILALLTLFNCKKAQDNKLILKEETIVLPKKNVKDKCDIPEEVRSYIESNKQYEFLIDNDLKLIKEFLDSSFCPTYTKGDFNYNGKEDIAIIIKYKGYKSEEYEGYTYPFLVIFNDYLDGIKPNIIYKTGDYKDEPVKTVIYDQYNEGIISYIKIGKVCEKDVIDIILPEKSSFFVYWNLKNSKYEFLNYLDDNLCKKINNEEKTTSIFNSWVNNSNYIPEIQITIKDISYLFHGQCIYSFPVKILNENEAELIWGHKGRDCVYEVFFDETFGLSEKEIPQEGKPFAKYKLENEMIKVSYYFEEWVERYKQKITKEGKPFPFLKSFVLKKE